MARVINLFLLSFFVVLVAPKVQAEPNPSSNLTVAQAKKRRKSPGVLKLFKKATALYNKKKYDDAILIYTRILKSYPGHEPSRIYIGKALYRLRRYSQSYKIFSQVNLESLDEETSYEYGYTYFRKKKYKAALFAFKRVPNGHPLYDLANYYGGVCAFKQKQYSSAIDMFDQAIVLPSKIMKRKKRMRRLAEEQVQAITEEKLKKETPPPPKVVQPPSLAEKKISQAPKADHTAPKTGFLSIQNKATLAINIDIQDQEFSNGSTASSNRNQTTAGAVLGKKFEPKLLGEKAKLLSKLTVQSSSISQDINSLSIGHEFEQDHVIFLTNLYELSSLTAIEALIAPEWDLGHSTWLATGISYQHYVFSGIVDASSTAPNFFIQLGQKKGSYNVLLQGRMILMTLDSEQFLQRADESLILDMPINQTLDLNLEGHLTQYSYKINETDGPDWRLKIKTNIFYKFTKNIKFGATGLFEQVGGNRRHNLNGVEVIGFDHENTGAGILLDISPFPWMKLSVIGQFHDRKVSGIEPDDDTSKVGLSESFSTYATSLSGSLTAQYQF